MITPSRSLLHLYIFLSQINQSYCFCFPSFLSAGCSSDHFFQIMTQACSRTGLLWRSGQNRNKTGLALPWGLWGPMQISLWLSPALPWLCLMTEETGKGIEGRVSGHRASFLLAHPQWTLKWAMGHTVFITKGFPIDFHCRQRRRSSRHHLASSSSACRLVLLNKVSRGILRCKRAGYPRCRTGSCCGSLKACSAFSPTKPTGLPRFL